MHSLLDARQQWTLAAGAILLEANRLEFATGYDIDMLEGKREGITEMLDRAWSIRDEESFQRQVESFRENRGHGADFDQDRALLSVMNYQEQENYIRGIIDEKRSAQFKIIQVYDSRLNTAGVSAWDWGRAISITRMAMQIGYMAEDAAWAFMHEMAQRIQRAYSSWAEFALAYIIGRQYWSEEFNEDEALAHFELIEPLLERTDSPWNLMRWEEDGIALAFDLEREE